MNPKSREVKRAHNYVIGGKKQGRKPGGETAKQNL